jgi:hypothetical protein
MAGVLPVLLPVTDAVLGFKYKIDKNNRRVKMKKSIIAAIAGAITGFILKILYDLILILLTTTSLDGNVRDNSDKKPLESVFVIVGDKYITKSDENGNYSISKVKKDDYKISFFKVGYNEIIVEKRIESKETLNQHLVKNTPLAQITSHQNNQSVLKTITVEGKAYNIPKDKFLWLVVANNNGYYPQTGPLVVSQSSHEWVCTANIGDDTYQSIGVIFRIFVVLVDKKDNQYFIDYLNESDKTGNYPAKPLPPSSEPLTKINLIRQ